MSELPYGPEDLKESPLPGKAFVDFLKDERSRKYPQRPAFYQALCEGKVEKEYVKLWLKDLHTYWEHAMVYSTECERPLS